MIHSDKISIPRADFNGTWGQFCQENWPFMPGGEIERLEKELDSKGVATHVAHTAGEFVIVKVKDTE